MFNSRVNFHPPYEIVDQAFELFATRQRFQENPHIVSIAPILPNAASDGQSFIEVGINAEKAKEPEWLYHSVGNKKYAVRIVYIVSSPVLPLSIGLA